MEHLRVWRWNCFKKKHESWPFFRFIYIFCVPSKNTLPKPKRSLLSQHPGKPPWAPRKAVYAPFAQVQSHEAVGLPFEFWSGDEIQRRLQFDLQSYGPQVLGRGLELGGGSCFFGLNRPPNDVK